jgi:molecular chaperone GrpE (heat shock protein)
MTNEKSEECLNELKPEEQRLNELEKELARQKARARNLDKMLNDYVRRAEEAEAKIFALTGFETAITISVPQERIKRVIVEVYEGKEEEF